MSKSKKLLVISCWLLAILNSCKDNTGNLGPNVLPASDKISAYQTDTTTISTSMFLKDSVITDGVFTALLGSFNDPIFGETKASVYAQAYSAVSPNDPIPPWEGNGATVDSAVLLLQLDQAPYYGSNDPQTFVVYQTDNNIVSGHADFSDTNIKYSTLMGETQVAPPNSYLNDTLRIKLNKTWVKNFSNEIEGNSYWSTAFNSLMKGIYITTATPNQLPGQGSLLNINLYSSFSGIYFFFHGPTTQNTEEYISIPIAGSDLAYFVNFYHNYSTTYLGSQHVSGKRDSINGGQLMYVQGMGGVIGRINFPNLYKNWSKLGPVIINEAIITMPVQPQIVTASYAPPAQINLLGTDTNWVQYAIPDLLQTYYGGSFDPVNNTYSCVITQYIQSVINGTTIDRGLYVCANNQPTYANGVVIYGAQHGVSKAQKTILTIYYTPVKH